MNVILVGAIIVVGASVAAVAVAWLVVAVADVLGLVWSERGEAARHAGDAPTFHEAEHRRRPR